VSMVAYHVVEIQQKSFLYHRYMSAYGPKRTWASAPHMSAFGGKADMVLWLPRHNVDSCRGDQCRTRAIPHLRERGAFPLAEPQVTAIYGSGRCNLAQSDIV
jgi:hypothetical protein